MTIVKRLPDAFTGDQTGVPVLLHGTGVTGVTHRWVASALTGADGSSIMSLPDVVGTLNLSPASAAATAGTSANAPLLQTSSGTRVARFDGSNFALSSLVQTPATARSLVIVAKMAGTLGSLRGPAATGLHRLFVNNATNLNTTHYYSDISGSVQAAMPSSVDVTSSFRVITLLAGIADGSNGLVVNGTRVIAPNAASGKTVATPTEQITLGLASSAFIGMDLLEAFTVPRALASTETDAIYTAMKARYGALVA